MCAILLDGNTISCQVGGHFNNNYSICIVAACTSANFLEDVAAHSSVAVM